MKIIISSKQLALELNKIDFREELVISVRTEKDNFIIDTDKQIIEIYCPILVSEPTLKQENSRWDWVKNLVDSVEMQPIVLEMHENAVYIIFQY